MTSPDWSFDTVLRDGDLYLLRGRIEVAGVPAGVSLDLVDDAGVASPCIVTELSPDGDGCGFVACGIADGASRVLLRMGGGQLELPSRGLPPVQDLVHPRSRPFSRWLDYAARALRLLRAGRWGALREKSGRYLRQGKAGDADISGVAHRLTTAGSGLWLIVDHGLGGGAGDYCQRQVADLVAVGGAVLIIACDPVGSGYRLSLHDSQGRQGCRLDDLGQLSTLGALSRVETIVYNTAAHFTWPLALVAWMLRLRVQSGARLQILLHDYFPLCPSPCLLDRNGHYCGVPDLDTCRRCLPANPNLPLSTYRHQDPEAWRLWWGGLLALADDIRVFSESSREILCRAYPWLAGPRLEVAPHLPLYVPERPVRVEPGQPLHIGVMGRIGLHKGGEVVAALARTIRQRNLPVRITVIGALEVACDAVVVRETGRYRREQLPALIEQAGINLMLFPSICPETFSYVVQEIMALDLPLACFDLGAQAERVSRYDKGLVLPLAAEDVILDRLLAFHRQNC